MAAFAHPRQGNNVPERRDTDMIDSEHNSDHEDGAWQDELESDSAAQTSDEFHRRRHSTKNTQSRDVTPRRRRKAPIGITVQDRRSPRSRRPSVLHSAPTTKRREPIITGEELANHAENWMVFIIRYAFDILKSVILMLKTPLKVVIFFWVLSLLGNRLSLEARKALSPVCWVPVVSQSHMCHPIDTESGSTKASQADFVRLEEEQSQTFHTVLVESFGNSALALDIKRAELATSDLATLVKVSTLSMKKAIEDHLRDFGSRAAKTADGLQNLAAKVNGAFDRIIAINEHAMMTIERARDKEPASWSLLALLRPNAKEELQNAIDDAFGQAMAVLAFNLRDLIVVAEMAMGRLKELEDSLVTLHDLATDSGVQTSADKDKVLGEIWTWLGGNGDKLRMFHENFNLLEGIGAYREQARSHVIHARQALLQMQATMQDMRQRAADPVLMGPAIPVEVHIKSINMGLDRMKKSRLLAREAEERAYNRENAKV